MNNKLLRQRIKACSYIALLIFAYIVIFSLPVIFQSSILYGLIDSFYILISLLLIVEAVIIALWYYSLPSKKLERGLLQRALRFRRTNTYKHKKIGQELEVPRCSIIVVAYLPNEQYIILDTLKDILFNISPRQNGLEIILAYNSPVALPVEDDLKYLAKVHPELRLLHVKNSSSKAENLNAALQVVTGEITCIFDADHRPASDYFERAWYWIEGCGYDVVQGRNIIRNHDRNVLTKIISVEFEYLYGVSHLARSILVDTALFSGSNGYWRTEVLKQLQFSSKMLTEDIDITMRTLLGGYRIVHDSTIITTELAPVDLKSLWHQRKRWAQGWLEVIIKYQLSILGSKKFDVWQKIFWVILLNISTVFHFIAPPILPVFSTLFIGEKFLALSNSDYIWVAILLTLVAGSYPVLATMIVKDKTSHLSVIDFVLYFIFAPLYLVFKNLVAIAATCNHLLGKTEWVVTRRGGSKDLYYRR